MRVTVLFLLLFLSVSPLSAWDFSSSVTEESRLYVEEGSYGNSDRLDQSLVFDAELSHSWDDDRKVFSFIPFLRWSSLDEERTHADIREASFVGAWDWFELRAGIGRVFWGVAESNHLVDVVNQTDLVENVDGEDKLGQVMVNPTIMTDYGTLSYFFLPFFRERTFSGSDGRFRGSLLVDTESATYAHADKENHIDHAFRYTHYLGDLEYGLSYFKGTDREPVLTLSGSKLVPHYIQAEQFGVDAQYIWRSLALKFEGLWKDRESVSKYFAAATGYEYTFSNVNRSGIDVGILTEYLRDDRGASGGAAFSNHYFSGMRLSFNDENGTEFLAGALYDNDNQLLQSIRVESSARWTNNWKWEGELNVLLNTQEGQALHAFRNDSYAQFAVTYYY